MLSFSKAPWERFLKDTWGSILFGDAIAKSVCRFIEWKRIVVTKKIMMEMLYWFCGIEKKLLLALNGGQIDGWNLNSFTSEKCNMSWFLWKMFVDGAVSSNLILFLRCERCVVELNWGYATSREFWCFPALVRVGHGLRSHCGNINVMSVALFSPTRWIRRMWCHPKECQV